MPSLLIYVTGDRIGDGLIKLPVVLGLREAFPGYHITWMAGRRSSVFAGSLAPMVEGMVDEVQEKVGLGVSVAEFLRRPRVEGPFDIIIDTQQKILSSLLLKRVPHRLFVSAAAGYRLSDFRPQRSAAPGSIQERLLELVNLIAPNPLVSVKTPQLPAPYLDAARRLLPAGPCYVGVAPGAGGARKRWPLSCFLELASMQVRCGRTPVFMLGPSESGWHPQIARAVPEGIFPEHEYRGPPPPGPLLAMALGSRLATSVANDAGPGHLLAACGRPVITLFGHTSPGKFAGPGASRVVIRAADFGGRDVSVIPVQAVAAAVERALQADPGLE